MAGFAIKDIVYSGTSGLVKRNVSASNNSNILSTLFTIFDFDDDF